MFVRMNLSTAILNGIIERWDAQTNPTVTISELFGVYPNTKMTTAHYIFSRRSTREDMQNHKKCLKLLQSIAKHANTDASYLASQLWMSAAPDLPLYKNREITRHYLNLVTILAKRPDVSKEALATLIARQVPTNSDRDYSLGYAIALTGDHQGLMQYLILLDDLAHLQKLDASTIQHALATPRGYQDNIGEVIAKSYSHSAMCMLALAKLLDRLEPKTIVNLLPSKYRSFTTYRTKEQLHKIISQLPLEQRIDACLSALDKTRPLGVLMHLQRGIEKCDIEHGVLSDCLETLSYALEKREATQIILRQAPVFFVPPQQPTAPPRSHEVQPLEPAQTPQSTPAIYPALPQPPVNVYSTFQPAGNHALLQRGDFFSFPVTNETQGAAAESGNRTPPTLRRVFSTADKGKEEDTKPAQRHSFG